MDFPRHNNNTSDDSLKFHPSVCDIFYATKWQDETIREVSEWSCDIDPSIMTCLEALQRRHNIMPVNMFVKVLQCAGFPECLSKFALQRTRNSVHEAHM